MNIIRHYQPDKVKKFEARWYVDRRLKCRFFATEKEREEFIKNFGKQIARAGEDSLLGFDSAKMRRWQEASKLDPSADPIEVMRFWIASHRPTLKPIHLSEAATAYLNHMDAVKRDSSYRNHVERLLADLQATLGDRPVHEFPSQVLANYILQKQVSEITKKNYKSWLSAAFNWWIEQNGCLENPMKRVHTPKIINKEPGILTPEETEALFRHSEKIDPEVCGLLALGAFAGMRTSAISRLAYEELDFSQRGILTPAEKTKTKRRNWIEDLPDNLWAWLERTPSQAFEMPHRHFLHRRSEALKRAELLIEADDIAYENSKRQQNGKPPVGWNPKAPPKNALRHSFVTYHVALHRNPGKTALIVSHTDQEILYRHYLGIATREAAERYFNIFPKA